MIRAQKIGYWEYQRINKIEAECQHLRNLDFKEAEPFQTVLDKFLWKVSASYYMCWYTLQVRDSDFFNRISETKEGCRNLKQNPQLYLEK